MRYRPVLPSMRGLVLLALVALGGWLGIRWLERHRPHDLPWTPLVIEQPVGMATRLKLAELEGDKASCLALFEASPFVVAPIADRMTASQCGYHDAVVLERMTAAYSPSTVRIACPLAAALAIWEKQVVQPAARRLLGTEVAAVEHFGTYSCRRLYGAATGRWSRHATAEAIDIAAFRLADGRRIDVSDWNSGGSEARFLQAVRDGGCDVFGTVLGPQYNAAHADHFHVEAGRFGVCR
jgi:hypothetical protein